MMNVSDKVLEKIKKYILCSVTSFPDSRAVYQIMWNNTVQSEATDGNITRSMRIACWITKATDVLIRGVFMRLSRDKPNAL